jgi:hypothetical protein
VPSSAPCILDPAVWIASATVLLVSIGGLIGAAVFVLSRLERLAYQYRATRRALRAALAVRAEDLVE